MGKTFCPKFIWHWFSFSYKKIVTQKSYTFCIIFIENFREFIIIYAKMKIIYTDELEELLYEDSRRYPQNIADSYRDIIKIIQTADNSMQLHTFKFLNMHQLKWDKKWIWSVRIDYHRRLLFRILNDWKIEIIKLVSITNHYE